MIQLGLKLPFSLAKLEPRPSAHSCYWSLPCQNDSDIAQLFEQQPYYPKVPSDITDSVIEQNTNSRRELRNIVSTPWRTFRQSTGTTQVKKIFSRGHKRSTNSSSSALSRIESKVGLDDDEAGSDEARRPRSCHCHGTAINISKNGMIVIPNATFPLKFSTSKKIARNIWVLKSTPIINIASPDIEIWADENFVCEKPVEHPLEK